MNGDWDGEERRQRDLDAAKKLARRVAAIAGIAGFLAGGVAGAVSSIIQNNIVNGNFEQVQRDNDISGCESRNQISRESNARIPKHELDARNLARLTNRLAKTRTLEAQVFGDIGHAFQIESQVAPLLAVYRDASADDLAIAKLQAAVHFNRLPIEDCTKAVTR